VINRALETTHKRRIVADNEFKWGLQREGLVKLRKITVAVVTDRGIYPEDRTRIIVSMNQVIKLGKDESCLSGCIARHGYQDRTTSSYAIKGGLHQGQTLFGCECQPLSPDRIIQKDCIYVFQDMFYKSLQRGGIHTGSVKRGNERTYQSPGTFSSSCLH
jgi:hypothetical protein